MNILDQLYQSLRNLIGTGNFSTPAGYRIYATAKRYLGVDASPEDLAPDDLACAETVSRIMQLAGFAFPTTLSTATMKILLDSSPKEWMRVTKPIKGDIILAATGEGGKNGINHGHVGIIGDDNEIMNNNSLTGIFDTHFTVETFTLRYQTKGGYPIYIWRRLV